jgi:hypothetical protein
MATTSFVTPTSVGVICSYTDFWCTIKDFQTVVSATVALVGVIGAILGIILKASLDRKINERNSRSARSDIAASVCSLIDAERNYFPGTNLFRLAREADVNGLIGDSDRIALALKDYIDYFTDFVSALSGFPSPISDRAGFMAWISARFAFAISAIRAASTEQRAELVSKKSEEIKLLIAAAIATIDEIYDELKIYRKAPAAYERHWREARPDPLGLKYKGRYYSTSSFDVRVFRERIAELVSILAPK